VFGAIEEDQLLENAETMGAYLKARLVALQAKYAWIRQVRGIGLMLGLELARSGVDIVNRCREHGLLINCTQERVLRIMPPLTTTKRLIDLAIGILDRVLGEGGP